MCKAEVIRVENLITSSAVTLYWEKPENCREDSNYFIYQDNMPKGSTGNTFFTVDYLEPDTEYVFYVCMKAGHEILAESEKITLKTCRKKRKLDITKAPYFCAGDGETVNTKALQQAIDDCTAEDMVYIPEGIFLTGALRLHSDMELYLGKGAVLQGTDEVEDYLPKIWSRFEGTEMECYSSLLNLGELDHKGGYNCRNVVIGGQGTIAGGGAELAGKIIHFEQEQMKDYLQSLGNTIWAYEKPETIPGRRRPRLINISNCQNVSICGLQLKNGPSWNVHMIYSDNIVTSGCRFYSEGVWNGDGWDPDSSSHCTIFDCIFFTGDDAIAVKSGKNPEGNQIGRPCEHIRIFGCRCEFGHGIAIGSEMSGGIREVKIWDCDISRSMFGLEIKATKKRGGYVKEIEVRDVKTPRILFHSVGYNDDGIGASSPPVFENCRFRDISIYGEYLNDERKWVCCQPVELSGFDRAGYEVKNIEFADIHFGHPGKKREYTISVQLCENITFKNISSR